MAQELNLFEEIENSEIANRRNRGTSSNSADSGDGPDFTLIGTSRIGDNYTVFLKDQEGITLVVNSSTSTSVPIPGHPSYQISETNAGSVLVRYPEDRPCIENLDRGIRCSAANTALITLTNADPLESQLNIAKMIGNTEGISGSGNEGQEGEPVNPFAALLEQNTADNSETDGFVPRRIRAEDVPSGMRVVSTPFGDRLVEE